MVDVTDGYDEDFLPLRVPLPRPADSRPLTELPYIHFTVLFDPARRLAISTGVNVDGAALLDLARADKWHLDPRIPAEDQAGEELYAHNDLDRGHLVRRRDPVWGDPAVARQANESTFVFTNAAPQAALFNQGENLWAGVENHVLDYARAYLQRISVFTAPVLQSTDPVYRGVGVPRLFWKIAAWTTGGASALATLNAAGFVLDQTPQLDDIDVRTAHALQQGDPPPLGPFLTYQVPISDIATLTGLALDDLAAVDRFRSVPEPQRVGEPHPGWARLTEFEDIRL